MDLLGLAAHELDEHVHDDAGAETVGDVAGEGREHHHDAGADGLIVIREVDLREALEHEEADIDQRRAGRGIRDGDEQRREEDGQQEHDACDERSQTGAAAGLHAGGGLDKGRDGGVAGQCADARADGVDEEGALNAGQIAVFIEHIGTVGNGEHRAERGEEITEEAHKHEDQAARGEYALEIEVEHDVAEVAEIRHGRDAVERRHAERDADKRGGDDADEDRAFDVQGVEHDDEQQTADGQQHGGIGEIAEGNAVFKRADAAVLEAEIGDEKADGCRDRDLDVLGDDAHDQVAQTEDRQQHEHDAGDERDHHGGTEAQRLRLDECAEDEVRAHAGRKCKGEVRVEGHQQRDEAGHERAGDHDGGLGDNNAVDVRDVRLAAADRSRLDSQHIRHGHKGGQTRDDLGFFIRTAQAELEEFLHQILLILSR